MTLLEKKLPPLTVMYIKEIWLKTSPPKTELQTALHQMQLMITSLPTLSKYYLCDVVQVMCLIRHKVYEHNNSNIDGKLALPSEDNFLPVIAEQDMHRCVNLVLQPALNLDAVSFYMYMETIKMFEKKITYNLMGTEADRTAVDSTRLNKLMTRFSSECKFKKTADLFIWVILFLKIPAWISCAVADDERPYAFVTRCHKSDTNPVVQPLIKESVEDLLRQSTGFEKFCIVAALALELTNHSSSIAFNRELLHQPSEIPTFAATRQPFTSSRDVLHEFGYVHNSTFYVFEDPLEAVKAWSFAVNASSAFSEVCCDERVLSFDNSFAKFLS